MPLTVPPLNADLSLRYYTAEELALIGIKRRGTGESHDHVRDQMGPDGSGSERWYSCEWAERYAAALLMTGAAKSYIDTDGKARISRLLPDSHPGRLHFNWICTKVSLDPFAHTGDIDAVSFGQSMPRFKRCDLHVTYELVPFKLYDDGELTANTESDRYVTEPGHIGAEITSETHVITMQGGMMNFATPGGAARPAGSQIPYNIGFPETVTAKKMVWRRVPQDLWGPGTTLQTRIKGDGTPGNRGYLGSLNLTTFFGHPPLTLKLEGVEERLLPDATGVGHSWDLTYKFTEKATPYGHTGLWFGETRTDGTAVSSGYYQALNIGTTATKTAAELAANDSLPLFHVREFANLFLVGAV